MLLVGQFVDPLDQILVVHGPSLGFGPSIIWPLSDLSRRAATPNRRQVGGDTLAFSRQILRGGDTRAARDRHLHREVRVGRDAQGRRDHGRHERRAGQDRRGRRRLRRDGARARARRHPQGGRRRPDGRPDEDRGDQGRRVDPGDGEGPDRALRRGADPPVARRRLHRRVRGPHARRRGVPHRQVGVHGAVRVRLPEPGRGAPADRRGRRDDPHEGRGRDRQRRRGGPARADAPRRDRRVHAAAARAVRLEGEGAGRAGRAGADRLRSRGSCRS